MSDTNDSAIVDLGRAPFATVHADMLAAVQRVRSGEEPGKVWLVEHEPVFTAGRASRDDALADGVVPVERGGRITYHGPGQLVIYPILRLPRRDVRWWLQRIEAFGVATCGAFGLEAEPSVDGTGVFVAGMKVASIGVAIRHWVSFHGIAVNVAMELEPFYRIRPCGLDPSIMTDLSRALGRNITMEEAKGAVRRALPILCRAEP